MISFVALILQSLVLQLAHCFQLIDPIQIDSNEIDIVVLLRMLQDLKL